MLNEIRAQLEGLGKKVFYGRVNSDEDIWDYIVFGRKNYEVTGTNNQDHTEYFFVAIIQEDYIEEGMAEKVINAMSAIKGMRVQPGAHDYDYLLKGKTNAVVEALNLTFYKASRGR